jgi:SHS2 domain-containing protein
VYRWVDHTAELELAIEASTEAGVFEGALAALRELVGGDDGGVAPPGKPLSRRLAVEAPDRAALLAEWLSELVYLAETEGLVPVAVRSLELAEDRLDAVVEGYRVSPRHLVKAVTYHGLSFERAGGAWRASAVLDV